MRRMASESGAGDKNHQEKTVQVANGHVKSGTKDRYALHVQFTRTRKESRRPNEEMQRKRLLKYLTGPFAYKLNA